MSKREVGFFASEVPAEVVFAGKTIKFEERMYRYAAAEAAFTPEYVKSISRMEAEFEDEIGSLDKFLEQGACWIYNSLSDLLDFTVDQLSLNGCYTMEKKTFFEKYVANKIEIMPRIYEKMQKVYDEIEERQAAKNEQRVAERKLHVAEGSNEIGEMLWNGMKRGVDELKNQSEKAEYYDDDVQLQIKQEYRILCVTMVDSFAEALWNSEHVDLRSPISGEDYNRTRVMFNNLKANKIPESRVDEVALEIFEKNPILPDFLNWAVARYGDPDGEMQKIANAFHVQIEDTKHELLKRVFDALDFSSEQRTNISKTTLEKEEKRLQYTCDEYTAYIEKTLAEFDLKARTVDGIEYDTREKAQKASKLKEVFDKVDFSSEESALEGKKSYFAAEAEVGLTVPKYQEVLDKKLQEFDLKARIVDGVEYDSREKAAEAKRQADALIQLADASNFDTAEQIQSIIEKIRQSNYTIPAADKIVERLCIRLDMLKYYPINHIETLKFVLQPKMKLIITISLLIIVWLTSNILPSLGDIVVTVYVIWLISLIFTTRKSFASLMEMLIKKQNYKYAAFCYELSHLSVRDFLELPQKKDNKGKA